MLGLLLQNATIIVIVLLLLIILGVKFIAISVLIHNKSTTQAIDNAETAVKLEHLKMSFIVEQSKIAELMCNESQHYINYEYCQPETAIEHNLEQPNSPKTFLSLAPLLLAGINLFVAGIPSVITCYVFKINVVTGLWYFVPIYLGVTLPSMILIRKLRKGEKDASIL